MLEKAFENWLAHGGARVSKIESASFPGGLRGIKATDTIRAGTSSQHPHRSLVPPPCIADTKHLQPIGTKYCQSLLRYPFRLESCIAAEDDNLAC